MQNNPTQNSQTSLSKPIKTENSLSPKTNEFATAISLYSLADDKFSYKPQQLVFWAEQIQDEFPELESDKLKKIILKGAKGLYKEKYESNICLATVIRWINTFLKEEKEAAEKKEKEDFARDAEAGMKLYMNIEQYRAWKKSGSIQSEIEKYQNMKF